MMVTWKCTLDSIDASGNPIARAEEVTVGTKLLLKCGGEPAGFTAASKDKVSIEVQKEHNYELKILKTESIGDTGADLIVTPWRSGEIKFEGILTDGSSAVSIGPIEFKVTTVIDQKTNPEAKPFPPTAPISMGWPPWFWIILGGAIASAFGCVAMYIFNFVQRKRFLRELEKNKPALTPFNQFNRDLRKLIKNLPSTEGGWSKEASQDFFGDLENGFRWYLAREFVAPVLHVGASAAAKEVKKADRKLFEEHGSELRLALIEIQKARTEKQGASLVDAHQISELTRALIEKINLHLEKERSA